VGECKFRNEKLDRTIFETLVERAAYLPGKPEIAEYILFSLGGFSDWFADSDIPNLRLITLEDMYESE